MEKIINTTPHPVNIVDDTGNVIKTFPKPDRTIRLTQKTISAGTVAGVPVTRTEFGQAENLPEFQDGIFYIVSQIVKSALPDRADLLVPAEIVRDASGNIIGCKSLGI